MVLRQNYGDKVEKTFNMSEQQVRWQFYLPIRVGVNDYEYGAAIQTLGTSVGRVEEGRFGGVPRGFARRSMGVGYGIRGMLREEFFLRWVFS